MCITNPTQLIKRTVLSKTNTSLFSFLVISKNHKNWLHALIKTMDPAGSLQLKTQLDSNIKALLAWIYSTWVNVLGIVHPWDDPPLVRRESTEFPGFLLPSQVANLMLVETEDLLLLITPMVWPIFGAMVALRYPTQLLKLATNPPHSQCQPKFAVSLTCGLQWPTILKDRKQVEHTYKVDDFHDWDIAAILWILTAVMQRLGRSVRGRGCVILIHETLHKDVLRERGTPHQHCHYLERKTLFDKTRTGRPSNSSVVSKNENSCAFGSTRACC